MGWLGHASVLGWAAAGVLAAPPAGADPSIRWPRSPYGTARSAALPGSSDPASHRALQQRQLERATAKRNFDARAGIRRVDQELRRRRAVDAARRNPSPRVLEALRQQLRREEWADHLAAHVDLAEYERRLGHSLGPATRRVLLGSRLDRDPLQNQMEDEKTLRALAGERREDPSPLAPPAGPGGRLF